MLLTKRSCSTCIWWSDLKEPVDGLIQAICEKSADSKSGGDYCGQWKKLKYVYNRMYDRMDKDYN